MASEEQNPIAKFFSRISNSRTEDAQEKDNGQKEEDGSTIEDAKLKAEKSNSSWFDGISSSFKQLIPGGKDNEGQRTMSEIVASVRERVEQGDAEETAGLREIIQMLEQYKDKMKDVAEKYRGDTDFSKLTPAGIMYYLEREDEKKNPSWKRRKHRFCPSVEVSTVKELNDALDMAYLSYAVTADEIRKGLQHCKTPHELVYVQVSSTPGKPAHFVAVKRDQSPNDSSLEVMICVRGTQTPADAITDLICDTVDYRGGKAHRMIQESGRYIAEKQKGLLEELCKEAGKKNCKVTLIGHSLGAGAASIAGMELKEIGSDKILVKEVIGFGCPALLSKELAEKATYITTVVNDSDCIPRMSGVSAANLMIDVMMFDWLDYAKSDIRLTLQELQKRNSLIFRDAAVVDKIMQTIEPHLENHFKSTQLKERPERLEPELYPPGNTLHFYTDGQGISGSIVPNTFFSEIDVTRRMIDGT